MVNRAGIPRAEDDAVATTGAHAAGEPLEPRWERAECAYPEWCERDHELD